MVTSAWGGMLGIGMVLGAWVSISSSSWVGVWLGLELNLLCFIPLMVQRQKKMGEVSVVYFLIQSCGSFILLMAGVGMVSYGLAAGVLVSVALLLKMGAAPVHFWYIWVAKELSWMQFITLSTIQKVAPVTLLTLSSVKESMSWVYMSIILCGVVGGVGGISALSFRSLLAYSAINHLGWILILVVEGSAFWVSYFCMYCILLFMVVSTLMIFSIFHLSQVTKVSYLKGGWVLLVAMMSLSGLPPLVGFLPKWGVFMNCSGGVNMVCMVVMVLSSVVGVYFYLRASFTSILVGIEGGAMEGGALNVTGLSLSLVVNLLGFWFSGALLY
uniref:NADH-ubiquinone oxidoreductase chain 2 n=1 Tax=Porcellionides pruinosus TaxID=96870 RepID=A0A1P8DKH7_PORPN|nr:NADH dehydrogenase subunit 2 [Porcellionides pruinosus]